MMYQTTNVNKAANRRPDTYVHAIAYVSVKKACDKFKLYTPWIDRRGV